MSKKVIAVTAGIILIGLIFLLMLSNFQSATQKGQEQAEERLNEIDENINKESFINNVTQDTWETNELDNNEYVVFHFNEDNTGTVTKGANPSSEFNYSLENDQGSKLSGWLTISYPNSSDQSKFYVSFNGQEMLWSTEPGSTPIKLYPTDLINTMTEE